MKCPDCGELLKYTACNAPLCTAYACEECGTGCDFGIKPDELGKCVNRITDVAIAAWQPKRAGQVLAPIVDTLEGVALGKRSAITRRGEREPIPSEVRRGVFMRDRGRCQLCGQYAASGELDHVVPWSAGGSDRSSNLRVACHNCNRDRSNFVAVADAHPMTPVALSCQVCAPSPGWAGSGALILAFCMTCKGDSTAFEGATI